MSYKIQYCNEKCKAHFKEKSKCENIPQKNHKKRDKRKKKGLQQQY